MEHAKRMVLVPEGNALRFETHPTVQTPGDPLSRLDTDLSRILHSKDFKNESEKWLAYQQLLERYLQKRGVFKEPETWKEDPDATADQEEKKKEVLNMSVMLQSVAQSYRSKARRLAEFISKTSNIRWTPEGRVVIDNVVLPNSNIADLLNYATRERKTVAAPNGDAQLSAALQRAGVSKNLIGNPKFWSIGQISPNNSSSVDFPELASESAILKTSSPKNASSSPPVKAGANWFQWRQQ